MQLAFANALPSAAQRFSIAYAVGSLAGVLAYALEILVRNGSPNVRPEAAAAYGLLGGVAGGLASLVLAWRLGPGAATRAGVSTLAGFLLLQLLYFANVRLLPAEPFDSLKSIALDLLIVALVLVPPFFLLRMPWVRRAREQWSSTATALGVALLLLQCGVLAAAWPAAPRLPPRTGEGPNLLLVVLDSVRRDHLSVYGYPRPTSPSLAALARGARVFDGALSASSWTVPSITRLLQIGEEKSGHASLPSQLAEKGYWTACFTDNPHLGPGSGVTAKFDVVERSVGRWRFSLRGTLLEEFVERAEPGSDQRLVSRALESVAQAGGPVFLYLHLMESHTPYDEPPIDGRRRKGRRIQFPMSGMAISEEEAEDVVARYDGGVRAADAEVGSLLEAARGWGRPFVAVITSDHGESLGESGRWFHGLSLAPELLAVPLLVVGDGVTAGLVSSPVDPSSIPKTLLAAAGVPCTGCAGSDLRVSSGDGFVEGGLPPNLVYRTNGRYKVVIDRASGRRQLFDEIADPVERRDIANSQPGIAAALAARLEVLPHEESPNPDEVVRLRSLGYIGR